MQLGATPHIVSLERCKNEAVKILIRDAGGNICTGSPMPLESAIDAGRQLDLAERLRGLSLSRAILPADSTPTEVASALQLLA